MAKKKKEDEEASAEQLSEEEEREQALAALYKGAVKTFGKNTLYSADEHAFKEMKRIPTGVAPLDYIMGGGVPAGRITLFAGHKSTAKTTNILRIIGNAQKMCSYCWGWPECTCGKNRKCITAWEDVEGVWDHNWASKFLKVDDSIVLSQPSSAEQAIDLAHASLKAMVDILVIDSIAFMTPVVEQEKSASEQTMGTQARLMGGAVRKFVATANELGKTKGYRPTIILTNQIRQKIGVLYGSPDTQPGGLAAGFSTSVEIKTSRGKFEMDEGVTEKPILMELRAKTEKNKTFPPNMEAEWKMALLKTDVKNPGDIIDEDWVFNMGERCNLISVAPQKVELDGKTFRGKSAVEKYWLENRPDYDRFKGELLKILLAA